MRKLSYLITASFILAACGASTSVPAASLAVPEPTVTPEIVEITGPVTADGRYSATSGQILYLQYCAVCHGDAGQGDGPTADALDPKPADFTNRELRDSRTPAERFDIITSGVDGTGMPPWDVALSEEERWAVLYYEWSLAASAEDIAAGQQIFQTNCAICHGPGGQGDGPTAESLDTSPADFTDHEFMRTRSNQDLFKVITNGKIPMPSWEAALDEDQRWQVITYLRAFSYQPAGPGIVLAEPTARLEGVPPSFQLDVLPILIANCVRCHSGDSPPNGLRLIDYEKVIKGSLYLPVIIPGAPESSPIYLMTSKGTMPVTGSPLSETQIQTIYDWIAAGAPDN